ncbi:MAG: endonuclease NucS, partial [Halobacteria archaeon]|nr:endonuclease NucS [Halobacteria archaeon]
MIFSVDEDEKTAEPIKESNFSELDILEEDDLQQWAIDEPRLLGEDLLVVSSEYSNFEDTRDRLDILALDRDGKLVVVELKRDRADRTTDLQAIKYAGYCATLTGEDIQKEYREFWNDRRDEEI